MFAIFLTLTVGIGGSFIFSYIISKPIKKLSDEVVKANIKNKISFRRTNIAEIDHLANMMEQLNQNVRDTALKFTNILFHMIIAKKNISSKFLMMIIMFL